MKLVSLNPLSISSGHIFHSNTKQSRNRYNYTDWKGASCKFMTAILRLNDFSVSLLICRRSIASRELAPSERMWLLSVSISNENTLNSLRPRQNERHFADDIFNLIFMNENFRISIKFPLKFVPKGPINIIPALVQIMAWRRPGDKPLSEPMVVSLPTHICVARPQWVKSLLCLPPLICNR